MTTAEIVADLEDDHGREYMELWEKYDPGVAKHLTAREAA